MSYRAFGYALRDWWTELIFLSLMNLLWLVLALLVVPLAPATAALFVLARMAAVREHLTLADFLAALGRLFVKSWGLAILSGLGLVIGVVDQVYYAQVVGGPLGTLGSIFLLYVLIVWFQAQCYAWAQLAWRPDLSLWQMERNGLILAARYPVFSLVLLLVLVALVALSVVFAPLLGLATAALWALICVQALARLAPELLPAEDRARLVALDQADAAPTVHDTRRRG